MEKIDEQNKEYINKLDNEESEIYIYDSIIESCDKNLFYLSGELFQIFCENKSKCSIITDVKDIFELVTEVFYPLFEDIKYIEDGNEKKFNSFISYKEILEFESQIFQNGCERENVSLILDSLEELDKEKYLELCNDIDAENILKDEKKVQFYIHICKCLFCGIRKNTISMNVSIMLYLKSMLMQLEKKAENTNEFLKCFIYYFIENSDECYFIWNQLKRARLLKKIEIDSESQKMISYIYQKCLEECVMEINDNVEISSVQRENGTVLVMSIQYLGDGHAPTKTIMERCNALKKIGKQVYFVNTTEQYEIYNFLPYFGMVIGKVIDKYDHSCEINMNGEKINFCQLNKNQSIVEKFKKVLEIIYIIKPEYVLAIGTGSILADLISYIVPCAEMALTFSTLPYTLNCIPILGRKLTSDEKKYIHTDIIESRFTFELKPQKNNFTREQFDIPQGKFVIVIVGIRLDYEITNEFLNMLDKVCGHGAFVIFAGIYDNYSKQIGEYSDLKENSKFIGYCNDMLALMEICDLYVNPDRVGGGFSVIEAFYKGKPGVYLEKGDVFAAGGENFAVDTLDNMYDMILKYKNDNDYYYTMSKKALKRANYMTSSVEAMRELDSEIMHRIYNIYN